MTGGRGLSQRRNKMALSALAGAFFHSIVIRSTLPAAKWLCINAGSEAGTQRNSYPIVTRKHWHIPEAIGR